MASVARAPPPARSDFEPLARAVRAVDAAPQHPDVFDAVRELYGLPPAEVEHAHAAGARDEL